MQKVGKVYLTDYTDVEKMSETTWVSYHAYCVCKYDNVRKLTQEELDELDFTSQQYVADETMYDLDEWNAIHDTMAENADNKSTNNEAIVTDIVENVIPNL